MINPQVATRTATSANGIGLLQKPRSDFESEVYAGECTHGTDVHDVTRIRIVERLISVNCDLCGVSPVEDSDLSGFGDVTGEADTACTEDAPFAVEFDERPEITAFTRRVFWVPGYRLEWPACSM